MKTTTTTKKKTKKKQKNNNIQTKKKQKNNKKKNNNNNDVKQIACSLSLYISNFIMFIDNMKYSNGIGIVSTPVHLE